MLLSQTDIELVVGEQRVPRADTHLDLGGVDTQQKALPARRRVTPRGQRRILPEPGIRHEPAVAGNQVGRCGFLLPIPSAQPSVHPQRNQDQCQLA